MGSAKELYEQKKQEQRARREKALGVVPNKKSTAKKFAAKPESLLDYAMTYESKAGAAGDYRLTQTNMADLIETLKSDTKVEAYTEKVRAVPDKKRRDTLKFKHAYKVFPTCTFKDNQSCKLKNVLAYNGLVMLDFDNQFTSEQLIYIKSLPHLFLFSLSVSGQGYWALFNTWITNADEYRTVWNQLVDDLKEKGIVTDAAASSPSNARLLGHDAHPYVNPRAIIYRRSDYTTEEIMSWLYNGCLKTDPLEFTPGNAHKFGFRLSVAMNEQGVPLEDAINFQRLKGRDEAGIEKVRQLYADRIADHNTRSHTKTLSVPTELDIAYAEMWHTVTDKKGNDEEKQIRSSPRNVEYVSNKWKTTGLFKKYDKALMYFNGAYWIALESTDIYKMVHRVDIVAKFPLNSSSSLVAFAGAIFTAIKGTAPILKPDRRLICFNNGVFNHCTGELSPFSSIHAVIGQLPYNYDPQAKAPKFSAFIDGVFESHTDVERFLQVVAAIFDLEGKNIPYNPFIKAKAGTGKSTMVAILTNIFGLENCSFLSLPQMTDTRGMYLDAFHGKFINFVTEIDKVKQTNQEKFNQISVGEPISGRSAHNNYEPFISYNYGRIFIVGNHFFKVTGGDSAAFKRRFLNQIFEFKERSIGAKINPSLASEISRTELSGIFNLLYEALKKLRKQNFKFMETNQGTRLLNEFIEATAGIKNFLETFTPEEMSKKDFDKTNIRENLFSIKEVYNAFMRDNKEAECNLAHFESEFKKYGGLIKIIKYKKFTNRIKYTKDP